MVAMEVEITYCHPCRHLPTALKLAQGILERYGMELNRSLTLSLKPGDNGIFDVAINGELVFSRHQAGRFPELDEVIQAIEARKK